MLADWRDGTLAERVLMPASVLAPLDGLDHLPSERLAALGKFVVPLGGLLRGRLAPGEVLAVSGASGYFGSAAVLLGLALGAERVVAAGRSPGPLEDLARVAGPRVVPVALSGDVEADVHALREAAGGRGVHLAFDQVGHAADANATLAALRTLRRGGRLVLMGSMTAPLPLTYGEVMLNNWEVIGNFMYGRDAYGKAVALLRAGLLSLEAVRIAGFALEELPAAMRHAAAMRGLDCTVVRMGS
jgi:alcohol dehydrogenase